MSTCRKCHAPISWLQRKNGSWYPPFDFDPRVEIDEVEASYNVYEQNWVIEPIDLDEKLHLRLTKHKCPPAPIDITPPIPVGTKYTTLPMHVHRAPAPPPIEIKVQPTPHEYIRVAMRLFAPCPKCAAASFEWCHYVSDLETFTKQLHKERVAL